MADRDRPAAPWHDWRTDTAERRLLRDGGADDRTRAQMPLRMPLGPSADLPRSPRWPLYADQRTGPSPASAGRGGVGLLPWAVAALVVVLAAGGAGAIRAAVDSEPAVTATTGDPRGARDAAGSDPADDEPRPGGSSRDADRGKDVRSDRTGGDRAPSQRARSAEVEPGVRAEARSVVAAATATAPTTAPPNEDLAGSPVTYGAANLLDGEPGTAWRMPGSGRGEVLTLRLERPTVITSVGVLNGYAKVGRSGDRQVDWYQANRRVRSVEWFFDDGSRVVQALTDTTEVQTTDVRPVVTSAVRVRISEVTAPGDGSQGRDYTAISEIALDGVPARG